MKARIHADPGLLACAGCPFPGEPAGYPSGMSDPSSLHAVTPTDGTSVTVYEDGPLIVRGEFVIRAMDGSAIEPGRSTVALCRCGYSAIDLSATGRTAGPGSPLPATTSGGL